MTSYILNRWTFLSVGLADRHAMSRTFIPLRQHVLIGDMRRSAVVIGATGATGTCLVEQLLRSSEWGKVTVIHRRPLDISTMQLDDTQKLKLVQHSVNMEQLLSDENVQLFEDHDVTFCTLGTTRDAAGTADNFRKVDIGMVRDSAIASKKSGVGHFSLLTSSGANANVWSCDWKICHPLLYMKSKGEAENAVKELQFGKTSIFRPGLLNRGSAARGIETFWQKFVGSTPVADVAAAMIYDAESAIDHGIGDPVIYEERDVQSLARMSKHTQWPSLQAMASDSERGKVQQHDLLTRLRVNEMGEAERTSLIDGLVHGNGNQPSDMMHPWTLWIDQIADAYRTSMLTLLKAMAELPLEKLRKMRIEEQTLWKAMSERKRRQFKAMVAIATADMTQTQRDDFAVCIVQMWDNKTRIQFDTPVGEDWYDAEFRYMISMGWDRDQARLVIDKVRDIRGMHARPIRRPLGKEASQKQRSNCCC